MNIVNFVENTKFGFAPRKNYDAIIKKLACLRSNWANDYDESNEISSISMACKYSKCKSESILAVANEDGKIVFEDSDGRRKASKRTNTPFCSVGAHNNAVFDLAWCDVDYNLVVGSGDHSVSLWNIGPHTATALGVFSGHSKSVKSVCFAPNENFLFASGARDGLILLWDARISGNAAKIKPYNSIKSYNWHSPGPDLTKGRIRKATTSADSISALLFQNNTTLLSCSVGEGAIKVWDIRKCYSAYKRIPRPVHTLVHPVSAAKNCFTSLALDTNGVRLYANSADHTIYCYNVSSYSSQPVAMYTGHQVFTLYVKCSLSPDGCYLVSGSSDGKAYIWRTDKPGQPIVSLTGHSSEVTCVDWCPSSIVEIATCSDDVPADGNSSMAMIWEAVNDDIRSMMISGEDSECPHASGHHRCVGWAEEIVNKPVAHKGIITPKRLKIMKPVNKDYTSPTSFSSSPTSNLPNYNIDGTSPHHQCTVSRQKENRNWLIEFKNKTPPSQNVISPKTGQKRPRQHNSKVCGNLLKFFKVSAAKQSSLTPCNQLSNKNINNSSPTEC